MIPLPSRGRPLLWIAGVAALLLLYFSVLPAVGLISPDEPRYAAIGKAMAQTGDWITPRLWGHGWFEKPALLYWMTAVGFKAGLDPDLAPRVPLVTLSLVFLGVFFVVLRKQFGDRAALFSTLILATSTGWFAYSHVAVPDLPMSAAFGAAILLLMPAKTLSLRRAAIAGALLGLAILAKGLVPLVLFLPAVWFLRREIRGLAMILAVAAVVAAPWYALVAERNGVEFSRVFFGQQQFTRFVGGQFLHARPFWFYIPVLAAGLFPWTPLAALLFSKQLYRDRRAAFLLSWVAFGFVFFSASRGKLPGYLLPLMPAIAALLGIAIDQARDRSPVIFWLLAASAGLLCLAPTAANALPQALVSGLARAPIQFSPVWLAPAILSAVVCYFLERQARRIAAVAFVSALTAAVLFAFVVWEGPVLDRTVSARSMWNRSSGKVSCVPNDSQFLRYGLNYYAGHELPDCK